MKKDVEQAQCGLDLRVFLEQVKQSGQLQEIQNAHWNKEIGALTEIYAGVPEPPALLFDGIPDYPKGYRVLSNILMTRAREALALGLEPNVGGMEMVRTVKGRLAAFNPIPPREVSTAPWLENSDRGEKVNLLKFPVPLWHEDDGGRYIGTFDAVICRDPDTGYINVGTYRIQVHDERHVGLFIVPGKHGDLITKKYWAKGEDCPVAIVCGLPPAFILATAVGIPWKESEYEFLGGLLGVPVSVHKGPVTGLPIPASAEIVLEGYVPPPDRMARDEGPFGEWPGYYASDVHPAPVVRVEALHHRDNPILTGDPPLKTYLNSQIYLYIRSANIWTALERSGLPEIKGVWFPHQGRFVVVVAIRQRYPGHAKQVGYGVIATRDGGRDVRMVIVVDEDIDITNMDEVMWAVSSRWDPKTASEIVDVAGSSLNPRIPPERRSRSDWVSSCIIIDACRPYSWMKNFPKATAISPQYRDEVLKKWAHLDGLKSRGR
ncbi:MAG: UbiD family decarboxylase [Deltaproteobacteria bacterium]|nr:UbiD family decarboxylase [Deltaproteobacteria bacterium]